MPVFRFMITVVLVVTCQVAYSQCDLKGTVADENGQPVAGASVWIYTARPRIGIGYL